MEKREYKELVKTDLEEQDGHFIFTFSVEEEPVLEEKEEPNLLKDEKEKENQ